MVPNREPRQNGAGDNGPTRPPLSGPYPEELPLPRSLPAGGEGIPQKCPPKNQVPGPFLFRHQRG